MHEISVVKPLISLVNKYAKENNVKKVICVRLKIGDMHDFDTEWIEKYFHKFIAGTPLEGAEIAVNRLPIVYRCRECGNFMAFDHFSFAGADLRCKRCGSENQELLQGREFEIEGIEAQM